ncbi:peregrin-like isoform X2 [Clytia hemisphaerica]|uniref:Peregrin n=1 Tax=Clytia hemisphaerica TaxID=252671 RepID=A0A7M5WZW0_9CNID
MADIAEMLKTLQRQKPPMDCPLCGKEYRSFSGISYHIIKFHPNGQATQPTTPYNTSFSNFNTPASLKKRPLSYADSQRMVEFDIKGSLVRSLLSDQLSIEIESEKTEQTEAGEENATALPEIKTCPKSPAKSTPRKKWRGKSRLVHHKQRSALVEMKRNLQLQEAKKVTLPVAMYSIIPEEDIMEKDVPERKSYFRYIDRTSEELDEDVEYGMDEEDYIWLEGLNDERKNNSLAPVNPEIFEMLMDRLEKESHFETRTVTGDPYNMIDEDAVCSICCDGECSNSNSILFCDMCNLAVHQECYGVPYIPEGQWLCRKCLQSPSKPVSCVLCPTKSGAFKQTDNNQWAHVVCALWIPEVCFANTVFLEPIDSIANIPPARWKLVCYICKKKSGACIQCFKTNCYTAFHVTCAQQGGLHMKIEAGRLENGQPTVKKFAYCDVHMPKDAAPGFGTPSHSDYASDEDSDTSCHSKVSTHSKASNASALKKSAAYQTPSAKLKEVQKKLLEKQSFKMPAVHIPFVPAHRLTKIVSKVAIAKKSQFIQQLQSYWMLKRQSRNGVPLLRRLQVNTGSGINRNQREQTLEEWSQSKELKEQLRYWQQLRHDLERVRLLIELIRKREKIKKEQYRLKQQLVDMKLKPQQLEMERTLMILQERDTTNIFSEPVKPEEAPDYHDFIKKPMDFSTMRHKLAEYEYMNFEQFETDFNLMIQNCLSFNHEDTVYYRTALRMRTQCKPILKAAHKRIKQACIDPQTGIHAEQPQPAAATETTPEEEITKMIENPFMTIDEKIEDLEIKLEITNGIKSALTRLAQQKLLRKEISKLKRQKRRIDNPFSPEHDENGETASSSNKLIHRFKKRGRKRGYHHDSTTTDTKYNGEVKTPDDDSETIHEDQENNLPNGDVNDMNGGGLDTPKKNENGGPVGSLTFTSPEKIVQNPSPGRSRRSGILFKKKQYQPAKPSPLVLYTTTTSEDEQGSNSSSSLKLRLRVDSKSKGSATSSGEESATTRSKTNLHRTRSHDPTVKSSCSGDALTNGGDVSPRKRSSGRTRSPHKRHTRDHTMSAPTLNGSTQHKDEEAIDDDCFVDGVEDATEDSTSSPRKRTYTGSSAYSDTDGPPNEIGPHRRRSHKRGRQKRPKLSFRQEFAHLEGLNDIKYGVYMVNEKETDLLDPKIEPKVLDFLSLIWAKCKGYPSYPALTIDPSMPRCGFQSNGVPIPIPPLDVLEMNDELDRYLILFFDAKRTWQWLPRDKIEPLGIDSRLDEVKLVESKKPSMRKNVQEAYKRAIGFRRRLEIGENSDEELLPSPTEHHDEEGFAQFDDPSPNENTCPFFDTEKESGEKCNGFKEDIDSEALKRSHSDAFS